MCADNRAGASFCRQRAALLTLVCPRCGIEFPADAEFCDVCAAPVSAVAHVQPSPAQAPRGSITAPTLEEAIRRLIPTAYAERLLAAGGQVRHARRLVTMLFSDVKGSTAMAETLDPEDVLEIMDGAFDALIRPIYRYEGTLARLRGDAILAFFGAPIAHEDDPERACPNWSTSSSTS